MKRLLTLLLALLFVASLAGCDASPDPTKKSMDEISIHSMYNKKTGQTISLDMTRKTLEKQLGKGTEHEPILSEDKDFKLLYKDGSSAADWDTQYISYGTGEDFLVVVYQGDKPVSISTYGNFSDVMPGPSNWCVKYGLSYGSSITEIASKYGETEAYPIAPNETSAKEGEGFMVTPNASWKKPIWLSYYYDKDGKRLENEKDQNILYQLIFILDEEQDGLMWYTVAQRNDA